MSTSSQMISIRKVVILVSISAICERFDQIFGIVISSGFALTAGTPTPVLVYLSSSLIPTVLLLEARVAASAGAISPIAEKKAWLILAWVTTVAGNLSLLGSASNLIVCEQARLAQFGGYTLTFWRRLKFGVPSTLIVTAIGLALGNIKFWDIRSGNVVWEIKEKADCFADVTISDNLSAVYKVGVNSGEVFFVDLRNIGTENSWVCLGDNRKVINGKKEGVGSRIESRGNQVFCSEGGDLELWSEVLIDSLRKGEHGLEDRVFRKNSVGRAKDMGGSRITCLGFGGNKMFVTLLFLPIGRNCRTADSLLGAMLVVIFRVMTLGQAYQNNVPFHPYLLALASSADTGRFCLSKKVEEDASAGLPVSNEDMNQRETLRNRTNSIEMGRNSSAFKEVANGDDLSQPGRKMLIQVGAIPIQSVMEKGGFGQGMEETVEEDVCLSCYHRNAVYFVDIGRLLHHFLLWSLISRSSTIGSKVLKMAFAATDKVVLGSVAFAVFWVLAVFPAVPFLPIGRTAGSLLGAVLMVIFRILTPNQAYAAIDLSILGLLFGTMVVSVYLERADMFKYLGKLLSWKCQGTKDLLCRICFISAISSSLFTNDTSCIVLTEFVLKIARQNKVPLHPFLLALASSANIGSSATPIGNPQNLVIAIQSGISFGEFVVGVIPAMLVGVVLNALILLVMYWKVLSIEKDEEQGSAEVISEVDVNSHQFSPATMLHLASLDSQGLNPTAGAIDQLKNRTSSREDAIPVQSRMEEEGDLANGGNRLLRKMCVYLVTVGMLAAFLVGLNMSWTAVTAALVLVVLDFKDARPCLEKVSYSLLVFFCGMFITVEGFNRTGIPNTFWNLMEPHARINHVSGIAVLALVVLVLSNVSSNVPTGTRTLVLVYLSSSLIPPVLLLGARVASSAAAISPIAEKKAWLILAWVSTVAGNLSLLGSAANLIVCEQARRAQFGGYTLTFWRHLKFGVPSTLVVTAVGLALVRG
ncbi:hypothetical protein RHSIM_RhsimUnG0159500 [Rhododendron simsii]|uniref:Citrate transporter-like domain-containing protein n=1 Tax=Rhododendron simsii TaxID=118357 RepID=A0A834FUU6_RHOSS|nr:hypothetical protein RHSIM_RhsimUnG0159500 [Rhododendron simsii]